VRSPSICHPDRPVDSRGLCTSCYAVHYRSGTHLDFPRRIWRGEDLVEAAERLRADLERAAPYSGQPYTWPVVAKQLGVRQRTLEKARERARRKVAA
jgi:hypothetical protein